MNCLDCISFDDPQRINLRDDFSLSLRNIQNVDNGTVFDSSKISEGPSTNCFNLTENFTVFEIPPEISSINMTNLISYSILFPFAAVGNLLVFIELFKNRHRKSRVNLMLLHLSIADMIVTFIFLPTQIIWQINIRWVFGNAGCKVSILIKFLSM